MKIDNAISSFLDDFLRRHFKTRYLWRRLTEENNFELIDKLTKVEKKEVGFGTIIVPKNGFSKDDKTHNLVLEWLKERDVNVLNVDLEVFKLEKALRDQVILP